MTGTGLFWVLYLGGAAVASFPTGEGAVKSCVAAAMGLRALLGVAAVCVKTAGI